MKRLVQHALFLCFLWHSAVHGAATSSVDIRAQIAGKEPAAAAPQVLHCFGDQTAEMGLTITNHCEGGIGLKVEFRQLAENISIPLGVVHELPFGFQRQTAEKSGYFFALKIPEVKRESDFELLYFVKKTKGGEWEPSGATTLRVYPDTLMEQVYGYSKKITFLIFDASGTIQKLFKNNNISFIDYLGAYDQVEKIDPDVQVIALCSKAAEDGELADDEFAKHLSTLEEQTGAMIILKKGNTSLSQLYVKEQEGMFQIRAEIGLLADLNENPVSQRNLTQLVEMVVEHLYAKNE